MKKNKLLFFGLAGILSVGTISMIALAANGTILSSLKAQNGIQASGLCSLLWDNNNKPVDGISQSSTVRLSYGANVRNDNNDEHVGLKAGDADSFVKTEGTAYANGVGGRLNGLTKVVIKANRAVKEDNVKLILTVFNTNQPEQAKDIEVAFDGASLAIDKVITVGTDKSGRMPDQFKLTAVNNNPESLNKVVSIISINAECTMFEDNTPVNDYRFEIEDAIFKENGKEHSCPGAGHMFYSPALSGSFGQKWVKTGQSRSFTFESDKDAFANMTLRLSANYDNPDSGKTRRLNNVFDIKINDVLYTNPETIIPKEYDIQADPNSYYFNMTNVNLSGKIVKGQNTITITNKSDKDPNLDYLDINTTAELTNRNLPSQYNFNDVTLVTKPTFKTTGSFKIKCAHDNNEKTYPLPLLSDKKYIKELKGDQLVAYFPIGGNKLEVNQAKKLTLVDAKFEDGTTTKQLFEGETIKIVSKAIQDQSVVGYVNTTDPADTYEKDFFMPNKDVTIKPVYAITKTYKLTLVNATFEDGTSTQSVAMYSNPVIKFDIEENKKLIGWYDITNKKVIKELKFIMPNHDVTISPLVGADQFAGSTFGKVNIGSKKVTFDKAPAGSHNDKIDNELIGKELGTILTATKVQANTMFTVETSGSINGKYKFTLTVANLGNEPIKIRYNQFTSFKDADNNPNNGTSSLATEVTEIAPNAITTLELSNTQAWFNGNTMFRVIFSGAYENVKLGMYQYAQKI